MDFFLFKIASIRACLLYWLIDLSIFPLLTYFRFSRANFLKLFDLLWASLFLNFFTSLLLLISICLNFMSFYFKFAYVRMRWIYLRIESTCFSMPILYLLALIFFLKLSMLVYLVDIRPRILLFFYSMYISRLLLAVASADSITIFWVF